jgi:hypothetical protein
MILPRDYVTPAQRLGRCYNHDPRHFRFQRNSQNSQWLEGSHNSLRIKLAALGVLLAILAAVIRW